MGESLVRRRFGKWRVIAEAPRRNTQIRYTVRCACGTVRDIYGSELTRTKAPSTNCGCERAAGVRAAVSVHGLRHHIGYSRWHGMISRCYDEANESYSNYGGRGIKVAREWRHPVSGLRAYCEYLDTLPGYTSSKEIDRIDNDLGYRPGNLRWATRSRNMRNRRITMLVRWQGREIALRDLCERHGINGGTYYTVRERVKAGWKLERALTEPIRGRALDRKELLGV